jgi:putative MATE family efflux protein
MGENEKKQLFESVPVPRAMATLAIPTIISQLINVVYNMVDAFFIGRTGNSYMMAATTLTLTLTLLNVAFSNLYGVGGGSLIARLMGQQRLDEARRVSAFSLYASGGLALFYALMIALFMNPVLRFLGASEATIVYARQYAFFVIVLGTLPVLLSLTLAHLLRNAGFSSQASFGLSGGGVLNMLLDPLFMFVLLPRGQEVVGAALATLLSNVASCVYLIFAFRKACATAPLSVRWGDAVAAERQNVKRLFSVGIPSAILTGLFDVANICVNILSAAHSDLVLAAMGIVLKVERVPNAINVGICQGMLPLVAYNYASGNHSRMRETIRFGRICGLGISVAGIVLLQIFAYPATHLFLSTSAGDVEAAVKTLAYATVFLRLRALASPFQFTNYNTSYCMQAMGYGRETMLHAFVRELVFYIPFMFLLDHFFGENGLAAALLAGEGCGAVFALLLLRHLLNNQRKAEKQSV